MKRIDSRLYLLFTPEHCASDPWATLVAAIAGGVDLVQWRVEQADPMGLEHCREICRSHAVSLIVNDEVQAALDFDLAGAHIGQDDMPSHAARALLGSDRLLGISTHHLAQVRAAQAAGADYLGFGPMYPTKTKGYDAGLGATALPTILATTDLPVFAIGGIDRANLPSLVEHGCRRIAVSRCILNAKDPEAAAGELRALL